MFKKRKQRYIIFWLRQTISQLGRSMTSYALILWVYTQTHSAMAVSILTFCSFLPYIIGSLFTGSMVDHYKKKRIMLLTDGIAGGVFYWDFSFI